MDERTHMNEKKKEKERNGMRREKKNTATEGNTDVRRRK